MKNFVVKSALLAGCTVMATAAQAESGLYVGAFGGIGSTASQSVNQTGTAHKGFAGEDEYEDTYYTYDLPVNLSGHNAHKSSTLFGGQVGYEFAGQSAIKPAIEIEGVYLTADQEADLENAADEVPTNIFAIKDGAKKAVTNPATLAMARHHGTLDEGTHNFTNTANMKVALFMLNGVLNYRTASKLSPYVGAGVGMAVVDMQDAVAIQTGPGGIERTGVARDAVNHFNSKDHANDYTFAVQAKAGVRYQISGSTSLFLEYRYINLAATNYTFGSTIYADHAPTDAWQVKNGSMGLHNGLVGVRFGF